MNLFFTPVAGKNAILKEWISSKLNKEEARKVPGATGIGLVHSTSNTCALDLDDLEWCKIKFNEIGIDIIELLKNHFRVTSPKTNRGKVIFLRPTGINLEYIKFPPNSYATKLELRCGNRYDVWPESDYPGGGKYTHSGSNEIKELPAEIANFWVSCLQYRDKEKRHSVGSGLVPLLSSLGKMSVIYVFNVTHPLSKILLECGYRRKGHKWQSPHSTSGAYGLTTQDSYLNPWEVCYSHHESDGELSGRPIDAFELAAAFSHPDKGIEQAKAIFTHDQANKLPAINDGTGEELPLSIHQFNNPTGSLKRKFERKAIDKIPIFPSYIMSEWADPWPRIWKQWKKMPRVLSPELLFPAVLGMHAHMLGGDFITAYGRKPGFYFLTIAPSTAHKDGNSRDAIQTLSEHLIKSGSANLFFSQLLSYPSTITADTSFIEAFRLQGHDKGNLFWLNTEATRMFHKISSSGNDNVAALADKMIEVVDGKAITGKQKVDEGQKGIPNPNVQIVFYTQPETIEKYITEELVDSGLLGRATITLSPLKVQRGQMFIEPEEDETTILDEDLAVFYSRIIGEISPVTVKFSDHGQLEKMQDYHNDILLPMDTSDTMYKMISRLGNTAEQLFAVIVGICHKWDDLNGKERRMDIQVDGMLPLLTYWAEVKKYVVENYVKDEIDPLSTAIFEVIQDLISAKISIGSNKDKKIRDDFGMIPKSLIAQRVKDKPKLKAKLIVNRDDKNVSNRIYQLIDLMVNDGTLIEDKAQFGRKPYIGIIND